MPDADRQAHVVLHIITGLTQGGAEAALYRLLLAQGDDWNGSVISLTDGGLYVEKLRAAGVNVASVGAGGWLRRIFMLPKLVRDIWKMRPDVVQTWLFHADLLGGIAAFITRTPVVWSMRCSELSTEKTSTRMVVRLNALLSGFVPKSVVSCSRRGIEVLRKAGYRCDLRHVPNGIDCVRFKPDASAAARLRSQWDIPAGSLVFGHLGRGHPVKDHGALFAAFAKLRARRNDVWLVMAGRGLEMRSGYLGPLLAAHPGIADRLLALGPCDDVASFLAACDYHVLTSLSEGFPNVIAEAMACGVPCITTDVGDAAEIVGGTGWVVPLSAPYELFAALLAAAGALPVERETRGAEARHRIMQQYSLASMVAGFVSAWTEAKRPESRLGDAGEIGGSDDAL